MPMPLTPEVLATQGEVVAWLGSLDVSFATEEELWFTVDGIESPRRIGSDGSGGVFVLLPSQTRWRPPRPSCGPPTARPFTTLFNRFSIDNSPMPRNAAA
jgi:hypothetical protein